MRNTHKTTPQKRSRFMIRESALMLIGLLALVGVIGFAQSASAISIKHNSMIETNVITLGDVFAGLEHKGDKVLGPAPQPGHDMTLNARTLMRIAVAMDLPWRPTSNADQVTLSRAATIINTGMITDTLKNELSAEGLDGKFNLVIVSGARELVLPYSAAQSVEVESVRFNGTKNHFDAVLVAPSKENPIVREKISGAIQRLTQVPVLRRALKNGNIIGENDIDMLDVREALLNHDMILSASDLVGMTPRRILLAGKPVKENEIEAPQIVSRGELVTMVFENGSLSLTAQAKALESGAKGDVIRVVNASSSRTLEAMITGLKEVTVRGF